MYSSHDLTSSRLSPCFTTSRRFYSMRQYIIVVFYQIEHSTKSCVLGKFHGSRLINCSVKLRRRSERLKIEVSPCKCTGNYLLGIGIELTFTLFRILIYKLAGSRWKILFQPASVLSFADNVLFGLDSLKRLETRRSEPIQLPRKHLTSREWVTCFATSSDSLPQDWTFYIVHRGR
jgi:hypothetical protein